MLIENHSQLRIIINGENVKKTEQIFVANLKKKGLKLTKERKAILNVVFLWHKHFDAESVFKYFKNKNMPISLATVYRTLPLLEEAQLIKKAVSSTSKDSYEHTFGHPEHLHFICKKCGLIKEENFDLVDFQINKIAKRIGFEIHQSKLEIEGFCQKCIKK